MHQLALIEPLATGPFTGDSHDLLRWTYQNDALPAAMRLEAARAAIFFEKPKLAATKTFNIKTSLRDLVLESMQLPAPSDTKAIDHVQSQPARPASEPKVIDVQPEPVPIPPAAEPDGTAADRGPLPGPDRAQDAAQRFEELMREREGERLRASEPAVGAGLVRPYASPPSRYSPKSEAALDVEFHVRRIRRAAGLPD